MVDVLLDDCRAVVALLFCAVLDHRLYFGSRHAYFVGEKAIDGSFTRLREISGYDGGGKASCVLNEELAVTVINQTTGGGDGYLTEGIGFGALLVFVAFDDLEVDE